MDEKEELFRTEGLSRSFSSAAGEVHALRNVSLSIPAHGLTILNGKSGSGKTTLINLLGGLDRPTSGKAFFEGQELSALSERARDKIRRTRIGFVFQSVALISFMTALENVEFGLRVAGCPAAGRRRAGAGMLGAGGAFQAGKSSAPGNVRRRAAAGGNCRAIAHRPGAVIADEPTAQLDSTMGLQVMAVFKKLIESQGTTVILTTHDPDLLEIADRVFTLKDGMLVPEEGRKGE